MASANQLGWLACIKYSSLQFYSGQFTNAADTCVPCSKLDCRLTPVSLPACSLQIACMLCINCRSLKLDFDCSMTVVFTFVACFELISWNHGSCRNHGFTAHSACTHLVTMHACKMCISESSLKDNYGLHLTAVKLSLACRELNLHCTGYIPYSLCTNACRLCIWWCNDTSLVLNCDWQPTAVTASVFTVNTSVASTRRELNQHFTVPVCSLHQCICMQAVDESLQPQLHAGWCATTVRTPRAVGL